VPSLQVSAILMNDVPLLGRSLDSEIVVEAARGPLIPGFASVKAAAKAAGAYGCTISGAGPTIVAVVDNEDTGLKVADAMSAAFREDGQLETNTVQIVRLCNEGAKTVST
jgi:homoserine kinase